jgi:hypothetical protein
MSKPKRTAKLKIDWKPWRRNVTEPPALSLETMHNVTVGARWAFCLVQNTRAELIKMHAEVIDPDGVDAIMRLLADSSCSCSPRWWRGSPRRLMRRSISTG